jgi:hypothetical protein
VNKSGEIRRLEHVPSTGEVNAHKPERLKGTLGIPRCRTEDDDDDDDDDNNNNSIQFFIIYAPSQQPQGQLQTQHSVDTGNYIKDKHNIKSKKNYRQALEEETH